MRNRLSKLIDLCRFLKRWRDRRDERERLAREHQLALIRALSGSLETVVESQVRAAEEHGKALIEVARASAAQAAGFSDWVKSFQTTSPPTTTTALDLDDDVKDNINDLRALAGLPPDSALPPEFHLALELQRDFLAEARADKKP